jgi:hypothetical protein
MVFNRRWFCIVTAVPLASNVLTSIVSCDFLGFATVPSLLANPPRQSPMDLDAEPDIKGKSLSFRVLGSLTMCFVFCFLFSCLQSS